jgi:hypothetical protein
VRPGAGRLLPFRQRNSTPGTRQPSQRQLAKYRDPALNSFVEVAVWVTGSLGACACSLGGRCSVFFTRQAGEVECRQKSTAQMIPVTMGILLCSLVTYCIKASRQYEVAFLAGSVMCQTVPKIKTETPDLALISRLAHDDSAF